ncbi:hypothetical protein CEUSTIGMA_g8781.t1 [Chlamydomonas eustigma]|uniref:Uncharacterized protein n=1 Tax=Chlamydomonas eustigma TaxID=1157962 RepID=A0A250XEZ3_9CHLO|nr:hypothetical protein CEUSTIGMA_g8781.t1 [Chlamydomonas eustigma]|eukprot:GAX81350.1 hypothetical protein CEUSTIGMA_g8781.t1 [Chlamydomonas eustigma]
MNFVSHSKASCSLNVCPGREQALMFHVPQLRFSKVFSNSQRFKSVKISLQDATSRPSRKVMLDMLLDYSRKQFNGRPHHLTSSREGREELREIIMAIYSSRPSTTPPGDTNYTPVTSNDAEDTTLRSDLLLLGIMASDVKMAMRGFRDWCQALNLDYVLPENRVPGSLSLSEVKGSVYLKYNSVSKACYLSPYAGQERGVLLQLGQDRLLGHFPLGLWDEDHSNPTPKF